MNHYSQFPYCHCILITMYVPNSILIFVEGFKEGINACCGIGPYEGIFTCGGTKKVKEYDLCDNSGEYVRLDSFHPTEKIMSKGEKLHVSKKILKHKFY